MPEMISDHARDANRNIITALTVYVWVVAGLIGLFSRHPKAAEWIAQSAQAEFVNEQFIPPESDIVTAKLGNVAYP